MSRKLTFYYDIVSPYSYIAFELLTTHYKPLWKTTSPNLQIILKPFFLGGVMKASENVPPGSNPTKARYLLKDLSRVSKMWGIKIKTTSPPKHFPMNTITSMRLLTAISESSSSSSELLEQASRALWKCYWVDDNDPTDLSTIKEYLSPIISVNELQQLLDRSNSAVIKDTLMKNTQEAVKAGAFGAPFWIAERVDDDGSGRVVREAFFGSDRFDQISWFLELPFSSAPSVRMGARL